jgi:hypothetical protein
MMVCCGGQSARAFAILFNSIQNLMVFQQNNVIVLLLHITFMLHSLYLVILHCIYYVFCVFFAVQSCMLYPFNTYTVERIDLK